MLVKRFAFLDSLIQQISEGIAEKLEALWSDDVFAVALQEYVDFLEDWNAAPDMQAANMMKFELAKLKLVDAFLGHMGIPSSPPEVEEVEDGRAKRNGSNIPVDVRWRIFERDNFTCKHCGTRRCLSVDHIIPKSKGGSDEESNLQTLCGRCNSIKKDRLPDVLGKLPAKGGADSGSASLGQGEA